MTAGRVARPDSAENARAIETGIEAQSKWLDELRDRGRAVLRQLEDEGRRGS